METVAIIGMGRLGRALDRALSNYFDVRFRIGRQPADDGVVSLDLVQDINAEIVIVTTNDDSINDVARSVVNKLNDDAVVLHTSGSLSSTVLRPLATGSRSIGSLHPLVSVTPNSSAEIFEGAYFCLEGDDRAVAIANEIVGLLRGNAFSIPSEKKAIYHAAAVTAAGHVTALIDVADEMMQSAGVPSDSSLEVLLPLLKSVVKNIEKNGTRSSLTGTYARGDIETARQHLKVISELSDTLVRDVFVDLAIHSVNMSKANGRDRTNADEIETLLRMAKREGEE